MQQGVSIWTAVEQVEQLQQRTHAFLSLYEQYVLQNGQNNEFLPRQEEDRESDQEEYRLEEMQFGDEGDTRFQPRRMELSRVFEDIWVQGRNDTLSVQLHLQGERACFPLNRSDNSYNLSNFSSFNNQKESDRTAFDFKDLLANIQERVGRQLNKKGIDRIIAQLQQPTSPKEAMEHSDITRHSLKASCIQPPSVFDFEIETQRLRERKDLTNMSHPIQKKDIQAKKEAEDKDTRQESTRHQKENCNFLKRKDKTAACKQTRIIRKNKPSLVISYNDTRQLEHFCISNKINNKEKQKISRAVREGKPVVCLD